MRTRERLATRLISGHAQSRLDRLSLPENPMRVIDAFRNISSDALDFGRITGTGTNARDGYAVINDVRYPLKKFSDAQPRLQCAINTGTRIGYAFDGAYPPAENKGYQSRTMGTSGQAINWVANGVAFIVPSQIDPINLNNGAPTSQTAILLYAVSGTNATYSATATTSFPGRKLFSIWAKSGVDTPTNFELQITAGTWVPFTATLNWQRFTAVAATGPAAMSVRVPALNDSVFLWGPQLMLSSGPTDSYPTRQVVGDTPVGPGTPDRLITKPATINTGTVYIELLMQALDKSNDDCYINIANFDANDPPTGGMPLFNLDIQLATLSLSGYFSYQDSEGSSTLDVVAMTVSSSKILKIAITTSLSGVFVVINGVLIAQQGWEVGNLLEYVYVQSGVKTHLKYLYRWTDAFSVSRMKTITTL